MNDYVKPAKTTKQRFLTTVNIYLILKSTNKQHPHCDILYQWVFAQKIQSLLI